MAHEVQGECREMNDACIQAFVWFSWGNNTNAAVPTGDGHKSVSPQIGAGRVLSHNLHNDLIQTLATPFSKA